MARRISTIKDIYRFVEFIVGTGPALISFVIFGFMPNSAGAIEWDGDAGDGLWSTPANWSGDTLPLSDDIIVISGDAISADALVHLDIDFTFSGRIEVGDALSPTISTLFIDSDDSHHAERTTRTGNHRIHHPRINRAGNRPFDF